MLQVPPATTIVNQWMLGGTMTTIVQQPDPQLALPVMMAEAPVAGVPYFSGAAELMTGAGARFLGSPVKASPS